MIGKIVYVVYSTAALKAEMVSEFYRSEKKFFPWRNAEICQLRPLKRYTFKDGWVNHLETPEGRTRPKIICAKKSNIYLDWESALVAVKKAHADDLKTYHLYCQEAKKQLHRAKENLTYCRRQLRIAEQLDLTQHFREENDYESTSETTNSRAGSSIGST